MKTFPLTRALAAAAVFAAPALAQVVTYHDVTAASHQAQFNTLSGQGYRCKQLSVAGGLSAPRYSAIWEVQSGPNWVASHNMTQAQYTSQRSTWIGQGYRPKLVTAAGSGSDTVFAAVFQADGASTTDLTASSESSFLSAVNSARITGRRPVSVDIHGSISTPLYCAVFEPNTNDTVWDVVIDADNTEFTATFSAYYEADARVAALGLSESQRFVSVWHDDRLGSWAARANYTSSGWQTQVTTLTGQGLSPLVLASGGAGSALRMAGTFAAERTPRARVFTATGQARAAFNPFDVYMQNLLGTTGARNASLAIAKDGRLVFARGYTWGEAGTTVTQPTSSFRTASLTKVLTSLAVHKLTTTSPTLTLASRPQQVLGLTPTGGVFDNISLLNCLEYTAGLTRNYSGSTIAMWANSASPVLPTTHSLGVAWLRTRPVQFTPGTFGEYSNTGYLLASQVVRQQTGLSMHSYLLQNFYTPLGITRARVAASIEANLPADEIKGYPRTLELAASNVHADQRRRAQQWAVDFNLADGSGGMALSTVDFARLVSGVFGLGADWSVLPPTQQDSMLARHSFPAFNEGPGNVTPGSFSWWQRPNGVWAYNKGGALSDASTRIVWRTDGIAIAVFVNQGDSDADFDTLNNIVEQIVPWPTDDLFPSYGLPSFPRRPAVTSITPTSIANVGNTPLLVTGERLDTVTSAVMGGSIFGPLNAANWHLGGFRVLGPTQLEFHLPQALVPGSRALSFQNPVGSSSSTMVLVDAAPAGVPIGAPPMVPPGQPFRVYCGAGSQPTLSFGALVISTSNLPSVAPGVVSLGLGNQFSDTIIADLQLFDGSTRSTFWSIPPLPWPLCFMQCAVFDPASPTPFPLPVSPVRTIVRQ
jgi:CubicO group peptidase (beta-lactamase class C family)